ncbi:unnamed protein product [Microthlaspi erraticum]|uniref:Uncharacterized protein n=1 Tax=Microthlaspi erraticum TaxID=1685480 RepID=A0A6D2KWJ7_9BRAS|nr:unnamed protein product [Microthlaspi erraticum]CAA7057659.1 unnamed protein product [Microthlaspi erraticum]
MLLILQWEPTVSRSFPSLIPFTIKVQGVPVHLWSEAMLRSIGEDLGSFESWEITKAHAKMRVHINGLLPLLKTYTLEFANGDEVIANLVYEKLEKHCSYCSMLDHEIEECPEITKGKEAAVQLPPPPQPRRLEGSIYNVQSSGSKRKRDEVIYPSGRREDYNTGDQRDRTRNVNLGSQRGFYSRESRGRYSQSSRSRHSDNQVESRGNFGRIRPAFHGLEQRWVETGRRISTSILAESASRERSLGLSPENIRRSRSGGDRILHQSQGRSPVESSHSRRSTRIEEVRAPRTELPTEALREARGEVREVMAQYSNCADPTESAARKERMRLAEERGEVEQTAEQMVRHSIRAQTQIQEEEYLEPLMHERIPATQRLGPVLTEIPIMEEPPRVPAKKRLGRPPNKKKTLALAPPEKVSSSKSRKVA